eukprot:6199462-Amphidinium_carterae.1
MIKAKIAGNIYKFRTGRCLFYCFPSSPPRHPLSVCVDRTVFNAAPLTCSLYNIGELVTKEHVSKPYGLWDFGLPMAQPCRIMWCIKPKRLAHPTSDAAQREGGQAAC